MVALGIDPGSVRAGYGLIVRDKNKFSYITSGILPVDGASHGERLLSLEKSLRAILRATHPEVAGVEKLFMTRNKKTAIAVAEARGVIIKTLFSLNVPIVELTPPSIKLALTGNGSADKRAVAKMVSLTLHADLSRMIDDATDALAIAIAAASIHHVHQ